MRCISDRCNGILLVSFTYSSGNGASYLSVLTPTYTFPTVCASQKHIRVRDIIIILTCGNGAGSGSAT